MSALGMTETVLATELNDAWRADNTEEMKRLGIPPYVRRQPKFGPRVTALLREWARMLLANGSAVHIPASGEAPDKLAQGYSLGRADGFKLTTDGAAAVATDFYLRPVNQDTPRGALILMANKDAKVTRPNIWDGKDPFWTHWAPMPKFPEE